jgi:hypothetical protein
MIARALYVIDTVWKPLTIFWGIGKERRIRAQRGQFFFRQRFRLDSGATLGAKEYMSKCNEGLFAIAVPVGTVIPAVIEFDSLFGIPRVSWI